MFYHLLICTVFSLLVLVQTNPWWRELTKKGINPFEQPKGNPEEAPPCLCVKPLECSDEGTIITDGHGIVGWRSGLLCNDGLVCCVLPTDSSIEEIPKESGSQVEYGSLVNVEDFDGVVTEVSEFSQYVEETTQKPLICGQGYSPYILKITGTDDETKTNLGDFPWMLLVNYEENNGKRARIGGASLIHPQVALTAAHTVGGRDISKLIIRGAEFDLNSDTESYTQDVRVKKIINHPEYALNPIKYDIAVVIFDQPFNMTITVRTICLPPRNLKPQWNNCYATGWGDRGKESTPGEKILRKALMSLVPRNKCIEILRKHDFRNPVDESFLCAGSSSTADTCQGDGGGPLACYTGDSSYYHLVGITSWGLNCGIPGVPGAYTDVTLCLDFIENTLKKENIHINI